MEYEYIGIHGHYINEFNKELSEHIKQGWQPVGSISCGGEYGSHFALLLKREIKTTKES